MLLLITQNVMSITDVLKVLLPNSGERSTSTRSPITVHLCSYTDIPFMPLGRCAVGKRANLGRGCHAMTEYMICLQMGWGTIARIYQW